MPPVGGAVAQRFQDEAWAAALASLRRAFQRRSVEAFSLGTGKAQTELRRLGLYDPEAVRFAQEFGYTALRSVTAQTAPRVQLAIVEALRRGESVAETQARLARILDATEARLQAIARTETNRAANLGRFAGWRRAGVVRQKEYLATLDDRVRPGHLAAHGEVVGLLETFTRGDARGFIAPPIAVNCRCTMGPVTRFTDVGRTPGEVEADAEAGRQHAEDLGLQLDTRGCPVHGVPTAAGRPPRPTLKLAMPPDAIPGVRRLEDVMVGDFLRAWRELRARFFDMVDEAANPRNKLVA